MLALVVISTLLGREQKNAEIRMAAYEHQYKIAREAYDAGLKAEGDGEYEKAEDRFAQAESLANYADPGRLTRFLIGSRGKSDAWPSLPELKLLAHRHWIVADEAKRVRERAQVFFESAVPLRFLLTGFGRDVSSASHSVKEAITPFKILGDKVWTIYPELSLLGPGQLERLENEVNEVLFLWVVLLETAGTPEDLHLASAICAKAMRFVKPEGPWHALEARVQRRSDPTPSPQEASSPLACFQWGMLADLNNRTNEAISWYKKASVGDIQNYWYHYYLAFAYDKYSNGLENARNEYGSALSHNRAFALGAVRSGPAVAAWSDLR